METMDEINIWVVNSHDLADDVNLFTKTRADAKSLSEVMDALKREAERPPGGIFGISIADSWPEKCYGFEVYSMTAKETNFKYLGVWKC